MTRPASLVQLGTDDDPSLHTINFCLYSHPGEGKTAFWGSGNNSVMIMDSDPGMGTQTAQALGSTAFVTPVIDYTDLQTMYEWVKHDMAKEEPGIRWVIWDGVTLFQERTLIDEIMPDAVAENPKQEEFVPSRREYLMSMNRIGRYVRLFVDLPTVNFGCSAHVEITQDSDGETTYMPQIQGKNMPSKIAGYHNVVGYMGKAQGEDGKQVQRILFRREGKYFAKDRFNALGHHVDKPTLPKIEQLINEKRSAKGKPAPSAHPVRRPVKKSAKKAAR